MGDHGGCENMVDMHSIEEMTARIVQEFEPERIILFGSYAYGTPTADSDVDLLVILPFEGKAPRKSLEILNKINPKFAVDILVRTPEQVQQRLAWNDFFLQEIIEQGKVLYEAAHA
jgi:predicted nucleotidyltransferase